MSGIDDQVALALQAKRKADRAASDQRTLEAAYRWHLAERFRQDLRASKYGSDFEIMEEYDFVFLCRRGSSFRLGFFSWQDGKALHEDDDQSPRDRLAALVAKSVAENRPMAPAGASNALALCIIAIILVLLIRFT